MTKSPTLLVSIAVLMPFVSAVAQTWDGGGTNDFLSTAANWNPDAVPATTADVVFAGVTRLTPSVASAFQVNSLTFSNTAGVFVFGGSGTLSIKGGGLVNNDANLQTFNNPVSFGLVPISVINAANGGLTLNGALTLAGDTLTLAGTNTITFAGSLTGTGTIAKTGLGIFNLGATSSPIGAEINLSAGITNLLPKGVTQTLSSTSIVALTGSAIFNLNENLTLDGAQLTQSNTSALNVAAGRTLTVQNGGRMTFINDYSFSSGGTIVVTGAGSLLNDGAPVKSLLIHGGSTLRVTAGGRAQNGSGPLDIGAAASSGTVVVDGTDSILSAAIRSHWGRNGGTATVTLSNGSSGNFINAIEIANLGAGSAGSVRVESGSTLTTAEIALANTTDSTTGSIVVDGAGSVLVQLAAAPFRMGAASGSVATLTVGNGGTFTSGTGLATVNSTGTVTIANGGTFNAKGNLTLNGGKLEIAGGGTLSLAIDRSMTVQAGGDAIFAGQFVQSLRSNLSVTGSGSTFTTGGDFSWEGSSNTLSILSVTNGGLISSAGALHLGRTNSAVALTARGAGSQIVASPSFTSEWQSGVLLMEGATATLGGLRLADVNFGTSSSGSLNVQSGATASLGNLSAATVIASATATITVDGPGSQISQIGASTLRMGADFATSATLNVNNGGTFTSGTGAFTLNATGVVNVNGGTATFKGPITHNGGTVNLSSGSVAFTHPTANLTIGPGGLLGSNLTLGSTQRVTFAGTTSIQPFQVLTLNGGTLSTGTLVNNGAIAFNSGTLAITGAGGFEIGSGALGANLTLGTGANLQVTNSANVVTGANFVVDGGSVIAGALNNSGSIEHLRGTLTIAGAATNQSGAELFAAKPLSVGGAFANQSGARITLQNGTGRINGLGSVSNAGLITGDGTVAVPVTNTASGDIRAESGKTLYFTGGFSPNAGELILQGGTLEFATPMTNAVSGYISGRGALNSAGLTNAGVMAFSGGNTDIRGDVINSPNGRIVTSGAGAVTTFFDDVLHNGLEIFTGAGASTVFFGAQTGAGAFTGAGTIYSSGDLRPGNSPASVSYGGNLVFSATSSLTLEIGGATAGTEHDHLAVSSTFFVDGHLSLSLIDGFLPAFGDTFDLLDAGAFAGNFQSISAPALSGTNTWDFSQVTSTGVVTVIPEPSSATLLLLACSAFGVRRRARG